MLLVSGSHASENSNTPGPGNVVDTDRKTKNGNLRRSTTANQGTNLNVDHSGEQQLNHPNRANTRHNDNHHPQVPIKGMGPDNLLSEDLAGRQLSQQTSMTRVEVLCGYEEALEDCAAKVRLATKSATHFEERHLLKCAHSIGVSIGESDMHLLSDFNIQRSQPRFTSHIPDSLRVSKRRLQGQRQPQGLGIVQAPQFWSRYGKKGEGVKVCVLDTGIDGQHQDLGKFGGSGADANTANWDTDKDGHGTHVSGTIAALDNSVGVVGVAPKAELFTVKVFRDDNGEIYDEDLIAAFDACVSAKANIISMSLGGPGSTLAEQRAVNDLFTKEKIMLVAASGNSGNSDFEYPASYDGVVSVGSVNFNRDVSNFSTFNNKVDLTAPGTFRCSGKGGRLDYWCLFCFGAVKLITWLSFIVLSISV